MNVRRALTRYNDRVAYPWQAKSQDFWTREDVYQGFLPRTLYNYGRDVQHGFDSNVIMAPVLWIMRTFTEARAVVARRTGKVWDIVDDHPLELLIARPNDGYDGDALWKAACISYLLNGNAYWRKVRNPFGNVIQLWYVPHWLMVPKWPDDGSQFISHYDYHPNPGGAPIKLLPRDVIHFRLGLDPQNTRLGISSLRPLLREVFVDDEAANFSAKMLENMGVPGLMVSPKNEAIRPSPDDVEKMRAYMATAFSGDNRGAAMVMATPTDVHQFGFDPHAMTLGNLRDVSEERVCSILGIPAAVVGFGSGLQSTKVGATMRELVRLAWVQCLIPMQKSMARQLDAQLLPDFVSQTRRFWVRFDDSDVTAFQEEDDLKSVRVTRMVQAGILRVDRAQEMLGLEVDEARKIYLQPSNSLPIDEHGDPIPGATPNGAATGDGREPVPAAVAARMNGRDPNEEEE